MRTWKIWMSVAALALASACGDDSAVVFDDVGPQQDTNVPDTAADNQVEVDAGPSEFACDWPAPYGAVVGTRMQPIGSATDENPFELQTCSGETFVFPDAQSCESKLTVISIAAGWCGPCILESMNFERVINEGYDVSDVRLIQLIIQTQDFDPPSLDYCSQWVTRFGLTNTELIDPAQLTQLFFPDNSLPSTVIIDRNGMILHRENGVSDPDLSSLTNTLNALLRDIE